MLRSAFITLNFTVDFSSCVHTSFPPASPHVSSCLRRTVYAVVFSEGTEANVGCSGGFQHIHKVPETLRMAETVCGGQSFVS